MPSAANSDQVAFWNTRAGETWARRQVELDRQLRGLGRIAMDRLAPAAGEAVLDIGCGCGDSTLELARGVGAAGCVTGVDISAPMLAVARSRPLLPGSGAVRWLEADAQVHTFPAGEADAAFSRFGVMFFADPKAAFANLRRALRPGGRLAFVCWRAAALNPFMTAPFAAAAHLFETLPPPGDPLAPGPFAFAEKDRIAGILGAAGFASVDIAPHDEAIGGGSVEETADLSLTIGPLGAALREAPHLAAAAREAVRAAVAPHLTARGVLLDSASWMVSARAP